MFLFLISKLYQVSIKKNYDKLEIFWLLLIIKLNE